MTYAEVQSLILSYAPAMAIPFADGFERFPEAGNAVMIADYLKDKAQFYQDIDAKVARQLADAATEIIVRCG